MNKETEKLLDQLVSQLGDKADLLKVQELLFKRGVEALLKSELTVHLGHEPNEKGSEKKTNTRNGHSPKTLKTQSGEVLIQVPRDRAGTFDPVTVQKHKKMSEDIEEAILLLYAKGMSTNDISDFIERTYGVNYSKSSISLITESLLADIHEWQNRPLEDLYPIVWIDGIHYKIRENGQVKSKACLIILGINKEGQQDILGLQIYESESASVWMQMFENMRQRGVKDILYLCSDNLKGLDQAVEAVFPQSIRQVCIVHQIRNSIKCVSYNDRRPIIKDIKLIYKADTEEQALKALEDFKEKWGHKYQLVIKSWETNWSNLAPFLSAPAEIRRLIYTTNIIESFNSSLRKYTKNKKVFPNDDAAVKSIYLAAMQIREKWQKQRYAWPQILNQFVILFPERFKL